MICLHTMAPDDEDLLKYALEDTPLSDGVSNHIQQCQHCQYRLARYKATNQALLTQLYRSQCPDSMKLSLYSANYLSIEERATITTHLQQCPLCAGEVADTRQFLAELEEPSPTLNISPAESTQRITATLVVPKMQLTIRNDMPQVAWPRQYRATSCDLLLNLSYTGHEEFMLLGLLTSTNTLERVDAFEGIEVELTLAISDNQYEQSTHATPLMITEVDDLGNFVFSAVPTGNYTLTIHLPQHELVVEAVNITSDDTG